MINQPQIPSNFEASLGTQKSEPVAQIRERDAQDIDLLALLGALLDRKLFILAVTALFAAVGIAVAILSTPIYKATALVQVEESSSVPGFDDMSDMFESSSEAVTEIELLKSRTVIGEAVDALKLHTVATPKLFPVIGGFFFRSFRPTNKGDVAQPLFDFEQYSSLNNSIDMSSYAWGGESIDVFHFSVPDGHIGATFELEVGDNQSITLYKPNGEAVLSGRVGEAIVEGYYELTVRSLQARPNSRFTLVRKGRLATILNLQGVVTASEKGKQSGIISLGYAHHQPGYAKKVLDKIAEIYVRQNVERNSAEAKKSLEFLQVQLPEIKQQLEGAENRFNDYQKLQQSVDISLETQGVLEQIVELDTKLQELELNRLEISRKFKRTHPIYQGLLQQIGTIKRQKSELSSKVTNLPETQQELLRLTRDVEVGNEIYMLLLSKTQELDIVRAGTVGNVRVVDKAAVDTTQPIKPKKPLIVVLATLLGGMVAVAIVLIQKALRKGVEDPALIEELGLPVYASIPFSDVQTKLELTGTKRRKRGNAKTILAVKNPADLSIESIRSLRTSLHFALMEAKNNVLVISGPSPEVGKSFVTKNLAAVLAQSGQRVVVIDGDLRKGYIQRSFGLKWDDGLSDYLSGQKELGEVIKNSQIEGLDVITRGQIPPNPSELLMHNRFSEMISRLNQVYDIVIIDTPPILAVTDPAIVSKHAGATLLVARFGKSHLKEIEQTRKRFAQNGVDIKGVVLNAVAKSASRYGYGGYYNYNYNYEYKSSK